MQYLGGKSKWGRQIVEVIEPWRTPGALFVDVFCGALNVVRHAKDPRIALDLNQALITTLTAVQQGWDPPEHVSREDYDRIKKHPDPLDPATAFVLVGCSFGGKWGDGYARQDPRPGRVGYAERARKNLLDGRCSGVELFHLDFRGIPDDPPPGTVLYCDPPYEGATGYAGVPPFDHAAFWAKAETWAHNGGRVFVSEGVGAKPPPGWLVFRSWTLPGFLKGATSGTREERLYVHQSSPMARRLPPCS